MIVFLTLVDSCTGREISYAGYKRRALDTNKRIQSYCFGPALEDWGRVELGPLARFSTGDEYILPYVSIPVDSLSEKLKVLNKDLLHGYVENLDNLIKYNGFKI